MKPVLAFRALVGILIALCAIGGRSADAQTWKWQIVASTPDAASVNAQSQVMLSPTEITLSYTAEIQRHEVPISVCRALLSDIASASAVRHNGRSFLLLHFKPPATASCNSGPQTVAMVPVSDDGVVTQAAAAINRACCTPAVAVARPTASRGPTGTLAPAGSESSPHLTDWVENAGLFSFVRVRNGSTQPVTIAAGEVTDCRNIENGCGAFATHGVALQPGDTATVVTVVAGDQGNAPAFVYHYAAGAGSLHFTSTGSSEKRPPDSGRMTAQETRTAEAIALASLRGQATPSQTAAPLQTPPANAGAKLIRRGSSRLGIGQTGVARMRVSLGADGVPRDVSIVSISNRQLAAAALETAVSSSYAPAVRNGRPVAGTYVADFQFDGEDPATASIPVWRRDPTQWRLESSPSPSPARLPSALGAPLPAPASSLRPQATPSPQLSPPAR